MKSPHRLLIPFIILGGFFTLFFYRQIFGNHIFYCCDNLLINIPSKVFLMEELRSGRFPLWNPYIFSGTPFLSDINLAVLYPANILYGFLEPFRALNIGILFHFYLALTGMYILGVSLGLSFWAAIGVSVVFGFSGTMVTYINNIPMLQVASILPWLFWAWKRYGDMQTKQNFVILVLFFSLQIIAGHPQLTYYSFLICVIFYVLMTKETVIKKVRMVLPVTVLTGLVTGVQILPFFHFGLLSNRIGLDYSYATFDSLSPFSLLRFLLPSSVGSLRDGTAWAEAGSIYGFIGAIPVLLLFFINYRARIQTFFLFSGILSLLIAFGRHTPMFGMFYRIIPGIGSFRSPQHFLLIYTFSLAILSGFAFERWKDGEYCRRKSKLLIIAGLSGIVLFFFGWLILHSGSMEQFFRALNAWNGFTDKVFQKLHFLGPAGVFVIMNGIFWNGAIISMLIVCIGIVLMKVKDSKKRCMFMVGAVFIELFFYSQQAFLTVPYEKVFVWKKQGEELADIWRKQTGGNGKFFVPPGLYPAPRLKKFGLANEDEESMWQFTIIRPNLNMLYHLSTPDGYASIVSRSYRDSINPRSSDPTGIDFRGVTDASLSALGVVDVVTKDQNGAVTMRKVESQKIHKNIGDELAIGTGKIFSIGLIFSGIGIAILLVLIVTSVKEMSRSKKHS